MVTEPEVVSGDMYNSQALALRVKYPVISSLIYLFLIAFPTRQIAS